ncbi:MAG TPA: hypothetical protein VIL92_07165 [Gaiellaceae bacterium]
MIDVEDVLRAELPRLTNDDARPDWDEIVAGAGLKRERVRRRLTAGAALLAAAAVIGLATPLGAAIARGLDGFSTWITGQPGSPASSKEQRSFDRANARSWVAFPQGTKLRHLITQHVGSTKVELLGFRSGTSTLCLRLIVTGKSRTSTQSCAPLADLRLTGAPVRVLVVDQPVGTGTKRAWYGIDNLRSSNLQITAGVAADSVRSVVLKDQHGRHTAPAHSNAFLYVAPQPEIGQRVSAVWARTATGLTPVPFSPSPFGFGGGSAPGRTPTVHVDRKVSSGKIGWLDRHENRGQPLSTLPPRLRRTMLGGRLGRIIFGRVLTPDPSAPYRVSVTLNAHRRGGPPAGICTMLVESSGGGGGCSPYPDLFKRSPISFGTSGDGPAEFVRVAGVVSDDVARLQVVLVNNQRLNVQLADNTFVTGVSRASLPARLVAYANDGKVIAASEPIGDLMGEPAASPARGRAVELLHVTGPHGEHAELLVGPAIGGGECMYVKHFVSIHIAGAMEGCQGRTWTGPALRLSTDPNFLSGRVRSDVVAVRLHYAGGAQATLRPTRGYVLLTIPAGRRIASVDGLAKNRRVIAHLSFPPPPKR